MTKLDIWNLLQEQIKLLESKGIRCYFDNHGFQDRVIKINTEGSSFCVAPEGDRILLFCMCLFGEDVDATYSKDEFVSNLLLLNKNHECTPWPG